MATAPEIDEQLVEEIKKMDKYTEIIPRERDYVEDENLVAHVKCNEISAEGGMHEQISFRASSIGYCMRSQYYTYMNEDKDDIDSDFEFKTGAADRGNHIHDMLKDKFKRAGLWKGDEIPLSVRRFNYTGHLDLQIEWQKELAIVEMKSMTRWKYPNYIRRPDEKHILQLQSYLWMRNLKTGYLLPYNKDTDEWTMLKTHRNEDIINLVINKLKMLKYYTSNKIVPDRPCRHPDEHPSGECRWCKYSLKCWKDD